MTPPMRASCRDVASLLLAHRWLQDRGFDLRTLRFDPQTPKADRIQVDLVWRRRWDQGAATRYATLTRAQVAELLTSLGGVAAL